MDDIPVHTRRRIVVAGLLLGVGLMALLDGALFHEVLGWHHLLDRVTSDPRANAFADGVFHLAAWVVAVSGVTLLWRAARRLPELRAGRQLIAASLLGAAAFNALEVVVDHFVLDLHRLHPSGDLRWDVAFLVANVLLGIGATAILRLDRTSGARARRRLAGRDYAR